MLTKTIKNITLTIDGTWYEISNSLTNNVNESGSCTGETDQEAVTILNSFINTHSIKEAEQNKVVKRVVFNPLTGEFEQLQAIKIYGLNTFTIQYYNSDLEFIQEFETEFKYDYEVVKHWENKDIIKGLRCGVLIGKETGDCTNNGISSKHNSLILVGANIPQVSEAEDITECVVLDYYKDYVRCKPVIHKGKWYMAGGNFIYSCDGRFRNINQYPISIHDRIE